MIVESGLGITGAVAYMTVEEADTIIADYGFDAEGVWAALDVPAKEIHLKRASLAIDNLLTWTSQLLSTSQGLEFPREPFYDKSGRYVEGVPTAFKRFVAEIAVALASGVDPDDARMITQESFGNSSQSFAEAVVDGDTTFHNIRSQLQKMGYGRSSTLSVNIFRA